MDDDRSLIAAVAGGDDLALRELFQRHAPWMAARLRRALPADAVEDVLQETFIAVWKGAKAYKGDGAAGAWLWGIGRRQVAMWLRKRGRPQVELEDVFESPGDLAMAATERVDLERAIAGLGPAGAAQRELVRLAWEEERPLAEVALRLGVPEGTVKSRLRRLRRLLQTALR